MGPWRTISVALKADASGIVHGTAIGSGAIRKFGADSDRTLAKHEGAVNRTGGKWRSVAKGLTAGLAVVGVALGFSLHQAISWESAFAGVAKTVDGTTQQLADLEDGLLSMSNHLPATREEIAGVAEAAGALGIQRDAILGFTEVMVGLGEATNLTADEAATMLAQFSNIMGTSQSEVDQLADSLVYLGNNGASTEREILELGLRLAGTAKTVGLTENQVLALANAMASMGIPAELGGGAFSRVLGKIQVAVAEGSDRVADFASVSKMSASEFVQAWRTDPGQAIESFVDGLAQVQASGGNVIGILNDLGIKGQQERDVMQRLIGGNELLAQSFDDVNDSAGALAKEVEERYRTAAAQMEMFRNQVTYIAVVVGTALIPYLKQALDAARAFGDWLYKVGVRAAEELQGAWVDLRFASANLGEIINNLRPSAESAAAGLAKLAGGATIVALRGMASALRSVTGFLEDNEAAVHLVVAAVTAFAGAKAWSLIETGYVRWLYLQSAVSSTVIAKGLGTIATGFATMGTNAMAGAAMVRVGLSQIATMSVSTTAIAGGAIAGLAAGYLIATNSLARSAEHGKKAAREFIESLNVNPDSTQSLLNAMAKMQVAMDETAERGSGGRWERFTQRINPWQPNDIDEASAESDELKAYYDEKLKKLADRRIGAARLLNQPLTLTDRWINKLDLNVDELGPKRIAAAIKEAAIEARNGTPQTDKLSNSYSVLADETSSATDKLDAWKDSLDAAMGVPMGIFDAETGLASSLREMTMAFATNGASITANTAEATENRQALSDTAKSVMDLAIAYGQGSGGMAAANLKLAEGREKLLAAGQAAGISRARMSEYLDELGLTPETIETQMLIANADGAQAQVDKITDGLNGLNGKTYTAKVQLQIDKLSSTLSPLGTSVLSGLAGMAIQQSSNRWGGITSYATGGIHRQAMMGNGTNRVHWDEPATGKEAYVPMRGDKWRSLSVLGEAAGWFGMTLVPINQKAINQRPPAPRPVPFSGALVSSTASSSTDNSRTANVTQHFHEPHRSPSSVRRATEAALGVFG